MKQANLSGCFDSNLFIGPVCKNGSSINEKEDDYDWNDQRKCLKDEQAIELFI